MRQPKFSRRERMVLTERLNHLQVEKEKEISEKSNGLEVYPERFDYEISSIKSALSMCEEEEK